MRFSNNNGKGGDASTENDGSNKQINTSAYSEKQMQQQKLANLTTTNQQLGETFESE